jgi:hypothetical protein
MTNGLVPIGLFSGSSITLWVAILGLVIAFYGSILSTFNFLHARKKERRAVKIALSTAMYTYLDGRVGDPMVCITVTNSGQRPIVVGLPTILIPTGRQMVLMRADGADAFPKKLEDGDSASIRIGYGDVAESLIRQGIRGAVTIRPECTIQTGERFHGKPWEFDAR